MNAEIKERWLKALRSGEYKQGQGQLHKEDHSFCCLGVLVDVLGAKWTWNEVDGWYDPDNYARNGTSGTYISADVLNNARQTILANMNDNGKSFLEIADHIETNL